MGGSGPAAVDYESLIDKFVDPKLPDRLFSILECS